MTYQNISPVPYFTKNSVNYNLQYNKRTGEVQLIQQNAATGTPAIYTDGKWNSSSVNSLSISSQEQQTIHENIQTSVRTSFRALGGTSAGLVLPAWAQQQNQGQPPGQSTSTPSQSVSSNSTSPGNIGAAFGALINPSEAIREIANQDYGAGNEAKLLFNGLKYPIDMNSIKQDTLVISQFEYAAPAGDQLLNGEFSSIIQNGLQRGSDFRPEKVIGTVTFPMPSSISETKDVGWGPDQMNNISAGMMADVIKNPGQYAAAGLVGAGLGAFISSKMGGSVAGGAGSGASAGGQALAYGKLLNEASATAEGRSLMGTIGVQKLLQMAQFGTEIETILARGAGIVPNNNLELLFNGPQLRSFGVSYRLTARSRDEAMMIRRILRFFKQGMSPKKRSGRGAGGASYFLKTPNVFKLEFKTTTGENKAISRFKTCALVSMQTDYTPDGFWVAYDEGQPVSTRITLQFAELEPIYDVDYQDTVNSQRTDLSPVANDAVGY